MDFKEVKKLKDKIQLLLADITRVSNYNRKMQFFSAMMIGKKLWESLADMMESLSDNLNEINSDSPIVDMEGMLLILKNLQEAQEAGDYVLLADLYELQLKPILIAVEERLMAALGVNVDEELLRKNIIVSFQKNPQVLYSVLSEAVIQEAVSRDSFSDVVMEEVVALVEQCFSAGFVIEPTSSGFFTIAVRENNHLYYMHTNGQVVEEALLQAQEWLAQQKEQYMFYGLGLGYPYKEMLSLDYNISIRVVETNREILTLAMIFGNIGELLESNRFELIYDPTGHKLEHMTLCIGEEEGFYVFHPALHGVKKEHLRKQLEEYFIDESSVRIHSRNLNGNFKKNAVLNCGSIEDLEQAFKDREIIIVAAGPSLDKNMELLKKRKKETVLLAVGTVLKKLLKAGIQPDYVIIIDSGKSVYTQIEDIECNIPLIFLSTVFSWVPRDYKGDKYILCQKGFAPAERFATERRWKLVESGGSVVTTALDMCLRVQVKKIIFVGLDLAFTNGMDHVSGTAYQAKVVEDTGVWVDSINGGRVQTGKNLKLYLDWIEKRLATRDDREKKIPVIDATEGGAKKKGMEVMSLKDALLR